MDDYTWKVGDRIRDDAFGRTGTVYEVESFDDEPPQTIYVRWDDGRTSDFVPDHRTHLLREDASRG